MPKRLRYNSGFVPCRTNVGDEIFRNGIFEFNISKLILFLHGNASDLLPVNVRTNTFPAEFSRINENHLDAVILDEPVITAEIAPGRYNLIDGHHRMEKARRCGVDELPCYSLNVDQHISFLTNCEAYESYVEYWNGKL